MLYCARASHDVVSWRRVRERDRDRFGTENELLVKLKKKILSGTSG